MLVWFLFLLPFLPTLTVSETPVSFVRVGAFFLVFLWILRSFLNKKLFLPLSFPSLFLATFIFFSATSILWAINPVLAVRKELLWLSIFPLSVVFWQNIYSEQETKKSKLKFYLWEAVILSSGVIGFLAIVQFAAQFIIGYETVNSFLVKNITPIFVGTPTAEIISQNSSWFVNIEGQTIMRSVVNFPDPHTLALFLGLTLPFAIIAAISNVQKRFLYGIISGLILSGLLLTFSRGAYIALVFSFISLIPFVGYKFKNRKAGIILMVMIISFLFLGQPIISRFISSFDAAEGSNAGRILIWQNAIEVFKQNPVIGVGVGNYPLTQDEFISSRSPINAHNTYLEIVTELGLSGLLLWLGMLTSALWLLFRNAKNNSLALAALGGLVFFATHGFFETIIYSPHNLVLLSFILGIAFDDYNKNKQQTTL